jgi:tetratricopeptide (TPR) repeat protein/DNA-binding XRE family transcriptional regulator
VATSPGVPFGELLRKLRVDARLTQKELAKAAKLSHRSISDLERGVNRTAHIETARLLADALHLVDAEREEFEALAWGQARPGGLVANMGSGGAVPRQLPAAIVSFTGRTPELKALDTLLAEAAEAKTVGISVVVGTAGIGKTTLAVIWAHQVKTQFGDGQLYVNLRGFDPAGQPMTPDSAMRGFLEALGVLGKQIPVSLDAQANLYRSLLAGRQVLVILDNASDVGQVRPLLPGSAGCFVVITSRDRLDGLITAEGARPLALDLPTDTEAQAMLAQRIGAARMEAEPEAVTEIITSCARLPLALSIVAARAATHPRFRLQALAGELLDTRRGVLDAFEGEDPAICMRAVLSWSYNLLSPRARQLFRLLGLHPGPDISLPAATSLAALPDAQAWSALGELARAHLVTEHVPDRFAFHDLLRAYAAEQAIHHDTEADRQAAAYRMADHYLHTGHAAARSLYPRWEPVSLPPLQPGVAPEDCNEYSKASAWFEAERPVLLAVIQCAPITGLADYSWQLSWTLMDYLDRRGHWNDLAAIQETSLTATQNHADQRGEAHAREGLGISYRWLGRYREAHIHLRRALELFRALGDQIGQADARSGLIWLHQYQGHCKTALRQARKALALYHTGGDRAGKANALSDIAWSYALLYDDRMALKPGSQALTFFRERGDRRGEAHILDSLGYAHYHLGHYREASCRYLLAFALFRELGDSYHQAAALDHLGDTRYADGDPCAAREAWQYALDILGHIPFRGPRRDYYPDADKIAGKLRRLDPGNSLSAADE